MVPQGEPARTELALGERYLEAIRLAGAMPVILAPVRTGTRGHAARPPRRPLPLRRARPPPPITTAPPSTPSSNHRARARSASSSPWHAAGDGARGSGSRDLPGHAGAERRPWRHASPAPAGPTAGRSSIVRTARGPAHDARRRAVVHCSRLARLLGLETLAVNSFHHQAIDALGGELHVVGPGRGGRRDRGGGDERAGLRGRSAMARRGSRRAARAADPVPRADPRRARPRRGPANGRVGSQPRLGRVRAESCARASVPAPDGRGDPSHTHRPTSDEAEPEDVGRVLLLYSGGLDTSVMLKWIQDEYEAEVVALTVNLGQPDDDYEVYGARR